MTSSSSDLYQPERARLLAALGKITEDGLIEQIEPIGSASVPELAAGAVVEIGLSVWPYPVEAERLAPLGYAPLANAAGAVEQRFQHTALALQLCITEAGSEQWSNHLVTRDYLRHSAEARQIWQTPVDSETRAATLSAARTWWVAHYGFAPVEAVVRVFSGFPHLWCISSGWALDLFMGAVSRVHHDVDVIVPRAAQLVLYEHLTALGWELLTPFENRLERWPPHMQLVLPRHQVHAHRDGAFIDILLTDVDEQVWRYRREPTIIQTTDRALLTTPNGLRYLAPELVLLFKSKNTSGKERGKDQTDFERVVEHLGAERRVWLKWALLALEPDHAWLKIL